MKITKLEQSGFIFESASGYKVGIDIGAFTPLSELAGITLDAFVVSHIHGDHFAPACIAALAPKKLYLNRECIEALGEQELASEIVEVAVGDTVTIGDFEFTFFDVDHGPNATLRPRENFGFLIHADGESIYFGGDIYYPSGLDVTTLEVDRALLPVGGFYTFGPEEAFAFAQTFKKIGTVTPIHYKKTPETCAQFVELATGATYRTEVLPLVV